MDMNLLTERHSMQNGNKVVVYERYSPQYKYEGTIYSIESLPFNHARPNENFVDHFYIKFSDIVYAKWLKRGSEIIYERRKTVVGSIILDSTRENIEHLTDQQMLSTYENKLAPKNINAMLVWRVAYIIKPIV
jgi:hypothetical protein